MQTVNRVAINTLLQYFQLFISVIIGLLTVRVVLGSLGEIDYGIYNLVAGLIGLFSFIGVSLSQTSIRYISVALGNVNDNDIKTTFAKCFTLHLLIAIGLVFILEVVGFIFFYSLNIPEERFGASQVVYHFMLLSLFLGLILTPFQAIVIAHEHFIFVSIWSIVDSALKLAIAYYISISSGDKLIIYGMLMALLVALDFCVYFFFSKFRYKEKIQLFLKIKTIGSVAGFAGWSLCDVFSSIINRQGYAVLYNSFFGPRMNTVYALAMQVEAQLNTVSASVINTMKPQIMKSVGNGDIYRTIRLSVTAGKLGFTMMALVSVPLIVMMPDILQLWLKEFPYETIQFARLMVLASMIEQLTRGLVCANQAFGDIKLFTIIVSSMRVLAMPISLVLLFLGCNPIVPIIVFLLFESFGSLTRIIVMKKLYGMNIRAYFKEILFQVVPPFISSFAICLVIYHYLSGIPGIIVSFIVTIIAYAIMVYTIGLTANEKDSIRIVLESLKKRI